MRKHCEEGLRLNEAFTKSLQEWGLAEVDRQAVEMLPVGVMKLKEISLEARRADTKHIHARRAYAEHIAQCLVCSGSLVQF